METETGKFWLWLAGSFLLIFLLFGAADRKGEGQRARRTAECLALGALGALLGAKLVYYICQLDFMIAAGWRESLFRLDPEEMSFYGGAAGLCLGVALSARGREPVALLNRFAPWGLALGALVRFGEGFLGMLGVGPYLEEEALCFFPLAVGFSYGDDWTEWYLAVYVLEGISLLIVAAISRWGLKEHRFLRSVFWCCLPQILLENLRSGSFMWFFCIRVEQLACMVAMFVILVMYGVRARNRVPAARAFLPAAVALLCAGLFIVCEFAMEGKIPFLRFLNIGACYGLMALGQVILGVTEVRAFRMGREGAKA